MRESSATEDQLSGDDEKVADLLESTLKSERIQLASEWFHCVKVPEQCAEPEHPWSALFDERRPERLVLVTRDGEYRIGLLGTSRQRASWTAFERILRKEYKRNATNAVKELNQLLSTYDALDSRKKELEAQLARCKDDNDARKIKKYEEKLAELDEEMKQAQAQEAKLRDLGLRRALEREKQAEG